MVETKPEALSWAEQYNRPEITPCKFMKPVLQSLDKVVFSNGNLRALCKKGAREPAKEDLANLFLEYATDIPASGIIPRHLRDLNEFTKHALSVCKPERLVGILLPVTFDLQSEHGIYAVHDQRKSESCKQGIYVSLRHKKHEPVALSKELKGPLAIDYNWSKWSARLREEQGSSFVSLYSLFAHLDRDLPEELAEHDGRAPTTPTLLGQPQPPNPVVAQVSQVQYIMGMGMKEEQQRKHRLKRRSEGAAEACADDQCNAVEDEDEEAAVPCEADEAAGGCAEPMEPSKKRMMTLFQKAAKVQ